jgi:lysyl-tRNA synthetase, class II
MSDAGPPQASSGDPADASADGSVEGQGLVLSQRDVRLDKRQRMLDEGLAPYALGYPRTHSLAEVRSTWPDLEPDAHTGVVVAVTGRVVFLRSGGKLCFATLREGDGTELQVMVSLDRVGPESLAAWKSYVDIGDHIGVTGEVLSSRRGELSVLADSWTITAKALRPLPNLYEGAQLSEDLRARQRYVDLVVRPEARTMARLRPAVVRSLRESFHRRGFVEVETPMLQTLQGGATARPFVTHANAFDLDVFLRVAPELFLKRCVVGGLEKVFEINRNFRNEGADSSHSPEFAMLEAYEAYGDYDTIAALTRELVQEAALSACGSLEVTLPDGRVRDLSGTWGSVTLYGSLSAVVGEDVTPDTPPTHLRELADEAGLSVPADAIPGRLVEDLFEHYVVPGFQGPTFVRDFPVDTSPLVRAHRSTPGVVEKWDLYIDGIEHATGYSELVDPVVQRERLIEQARLRTGGDVEAMPLDEDFLRAMEHGMPPMGGMGMGIDRLLMALTGLGIRETILFPLVRPEG